MSELNQRNIQRVSELIAKMIEDAKQLLIDAKQIAEDNDLEYSLEGMIGGMMDEVSNNQMWYGSDQSLC